MGIFVLARDEVVNSHLRVRQVAGSDMQVITGARHGGKYRVDDDTLADTHAAYDTQEEAEAEARARLQAEWDRLHPAG